MRAAKRKAAEALRESQSPERKGKRVASSSSSSRKRKAQDDSDYESESFEEENGGEEDDSGAFVASDAGEPESEPEDAVAYDSADESDTPRGKAKSKGKGKSPAKRGGTGKSTATTKKGKAPEGAAPAPAHSTGFSGKELIRLVFSADAPVPFSTSTSSSSSASASASGPGDAYAASAPPMRPHGLAYHHPLLLDARAGSAGAEARKSLLLWYARVKTDREMPWRMEWIDPEPSAEGAADEPGAEAGAPKTKPRTKKEIDAALKERAYRVWISEIMLQQTRVATVKAYYARWVAQWPSIEALAAAAPDAVLGAWKGLGYYSRAARIHAAAQRLVDTRAGALPQTPEELVRDVPGVGPYTAGAISSIVFGHAVPILDGNVIRVLARQMGLLASGKEKAVTDLLWEAARRLVRRAAMDGLPEGNGAGAGQEGDDEQARKKAEAKAQRIAVGDTTLKRSAVPGDWNQALMELGSTVCAPQPSCGECPITATCRAYNEGMLLARGGGAAVRGNSSAEIPDIEDLCTACAPVPVGDAAEEADEKPAAGAKLGKEKGKGKGKGLTQSTLSFGSSAPKSSKAPPPAAAPAFNAQAAAHVKLMPLKVAKSASKHERVAVCVIEDMRGAAAGVEGQGQGKSAGKGKGSSKGAGAPTFLLEQRPAQGLLASMWQFPMLSFGHAEPPPEAQRRARAEHFARAVVAAHPPGAAAGDEDLKVDVVRTLGVVQHVFSHLVLDMYVYVLEVRGGGGEASEGSSASASGSGKEKGAVKGKAKSKGAGAAEADAAPADMPRKWCDKEALEAANMGTGMVNVWQAYRAWREGAGAARK